MGKKRTARGDREPGMVSGEPGEERQDSGEIANGWRELGYGVTEARGNQAGGWYLLCRTETEAARSYENTSKPTQYDFENHLHLTDFGKIIAKMKGEHVGETNIKDVLNWGVVHHFTPPSTTFPITGAGFSRFLYHWSRVLYVRLGDHACPRD